MKIQDSANSVLLSFAISAIGLASSVHGQEIVSMPGRGGGLDTNAPMIHVDIFFDAQSGELQAVADTNYARPGLKPLPEGYAFDLASKYRVISGKAYNFQYAWNPGSMFSPPEGTAIWVECLESTPGLETYDGPGNKKENPPRSYSPIFGTDGSARIWKWYGRMAHNTYAIRNPVTNVLSATYRAYIGDADTGARDRSYTSSTVTLVWDIDEPRFVSPSTGGGQTFGEMVHIDVTLETDKLAAHIDDTIPAPELKPIAAGLSFEPGANYAVLNGRTYNAQYGWNVGGFFTLPAGSAIWIEQTAASPGLEVYEGSGRNGSYKPIFGTRGSPRLWKWSGVMAHNTYAMLNPRWNNCYAEYRVFVGDAETGSRTAYAGISETSVRLLWSTAPAAFPSRIGISSLECLEGCVTATFMGLSGRTFFLERANSFSAAAWKRVSGPLEGANAWQQLKDVTAGNSRAFYRLSFEE